MEYTCNHSTEHWESKVDTDRLIELKTKLWEGKYEISPEELTELAWLQRKHVGEIRTGANMIQQEAQKIMTSE